MKRDFGLRSTSEGSFREYTYHLQCYFVMAYARHRKGVAGWPVSLLVWSFVNSNCLPIPAYISVTLYIPAPVAAATRGLLRLPSASVYSITLIP